MGLTTTPNMRHEDLAVGNLLGFEFEMDGRIVLDGVEQVVLPDGRVALHQDEPPEIEALRRLARGELFERETKGAGLLREFKAEVDLNRIKEAFGRLPPGITIGSLGEALVIVDKIINGNGRYRALRQAVERLHVPDESRDLLLKRWKEMGGPLLKDFAPYSYHVLRVDRLFDLGIGSGLIPTGNSNHYIDIMYLYYLPFCEVFVSTDKFHREIVPLFFAKRSTVRWGERFEGRCDEAETILRVLIRRHSSDRIDELRSTSA
jgi:hypothetical protein